MWEEDTRAHPTMPIWPFNKKRRTSAVKGAGPQPVSEKAQPTPPPLSSPPPPLPRRSSARGRERKRRALPQSTSTEAQGKRQGSAGKEHKPQRRSSIEDITALPMSQTLPSSPHLRPIDTERPHISYNFQQYSGSQTSLPRQESTSRSRPQTIRSRKSVYDSATPRRRRSSKKRKDVPLREEEIRAMSAPLSIPKRAGEGPLRRESKKLRSGKRESNISLPPEESINSSMSGVQEQRGWEVGFLDVFNPRPAVRLSGTPQYVTSGSLPTASPLSRTSRDERRKVKDKTPVPTETTRKRQTIGVQADDLDASDLRTLLERDAKRKEKRKQEQQEKLDRKLRNRAGRNRGDSDRRKREAEDVRRAEEAKQRNEQREREREREREGVPPLPPTKVHPALRDQAAEAGAEIGPVGLGVETSEAAGEAPSSEGKPEQAVSDTEEPSTQRTGTYLQYEPEDDKAQDPFADPEAISAVGGRETASPAPFETPLATPMEDPVVATAKAVRVSQTSTPPLSPVQTTQSARVTSGLAQGLRISDLPEPPPISTHRRPSETKERRVGAWASFFRRGGTNFRKPGEEGRASSSEFSFSNTSRESMRNQPVPAHLIDTQSSLRSRSGTPVRTQSKFREDLPEMPISPPDSRMPSPDVTMAAASAAASRRTMRSPNLVDIPNAKTRDPDTDTQPHGRSDTPIGPSARPPGLVSASLASVDSEASWLASSAKRQSEQSGLSRGMGSLSKRKPEFNASYEELGGDKDAEYFQHAPPPPTALHTPHFGRTSAADAGASPDEESVYGDDATPSETPAGEPLTVHRSVRRQPTLVRRDPRVKSREGLLAQEDTAEVVDAEAESEAEAGEDSPATAAAARDELFDLEEPSSRVQLRNARSVDYGKGHARQMSAGSAKLLDIPAATTAGRGAPADRVGGDVSRAASVREGAAAGAKM